MSGVTVSLTTGNDTFPGASDTNTGNDSVFGSLGADSILGGLGNDTLDGRDGNDEIFAGEGNDRVLGGMLVVTSIATLFQKQLAVMAKQHERLDDRQARIPTILLGALLGVAVSITSVGAGAIGVTVLLMLYPALRVAKIVGTDIAHAVPLTLVAGCGHWIIGDVDFGLLASLLVGSLPGAVVGSMLSTRSPDHVLRPALAAILMISGIRLLSQ